MGRTDMRGRTALDHARNQPKARKLLRKHGGLTSQELAGKVEQFAQHIVDTEAKRVTLQAQLDELPSAYVRERTKSRRWSFAQDKHENVPIMQIPPSASRRPFSQSRSNCFQEDSKGLVSKDCFLENPKV